MPDVPTYLHRYLFISALLCFSTLPISSSCVLSGIKVWIRQLGGALDQSERSIPPRQTEKICADWQTSDRSDPVRSVLVFSRRVSTCFILVWFKSCLVLFTSDTLLFLNKCQVINQYFRESWLFERRYSNLCTPLMCFSFFLSSNSGLVLGQTILIGFTSCCKHRNQLRNDR